MNRGADSPRAKNPHAPLLIAGELIAQGSRWVLAEGNSMAPTLRTGDRVLLRYVQPADVRPGDIVALAAAPAAVLHRVAWVSPEGTVSTRGDAMLSNDPAVPRDDIIGVAVLAGRGETRIALQRTLEFGAVAYVRGLVLFARWWIARARRKACILLSRPGVRG